MSAPGEGQERGGGRSLTVAERDEARRLWADGNDLGEIAMHLGCSIYALSPWLYADTIHAALEEPDHATD